MEQPDSTSPQRLTSSNPPDSALTNQTPRTLFADLLLQHAAAEDLKRLDASARAMLGAAAFDHLAAPRGTDASILLSDRPGYDATILEVVNDDMPFLLDSTLAVLSERGIEPRLVAHPIVYVERDAAGALLSIGAVSGAGKRESLIHIHLPLMVNPEDHQSLSDALALTYRDIRSAVQDWAPMKERLAQAIIAYKTNPPPLDVAEIAEAVQFLDWIQADHFTFTGMRDYILSDGAASVDARDGTGLGILRDPTVRVLRRGSELVAITPEVLAFLKEPVALIITKANVKSRVHRRAHMDYIGVKLFDQMGHLSGELRITGLFTSSAYNSTVRSIPYIRHKVARVFERAGFAAESYSGRGLSHVLESYPRDELFQADEATLLNFSLDILQLSERPRIRALARVDRFDRFVSVMVYIPKDRYDTTIRRKVGAYLAEIYQGRLSAAYPAYPDGPLARTHFIIGRDEGKTPAISREELEAAITQIVRTWADGLKDVLQTSKDMGSAAMLFSRYGEAFTGAYREAFTPAESLADIAKIERLNEERPRSVVFYRRDGDEETRASLKVFARGAPSPLSQRVPLLEDLGFTVINERTYRVAPADASEDARVWLHDMTLERKAGGPIDVAGLKERIESLLMALFRGLAESDGYNGLVIEAGLAWREIAVLRTLSLYLRQIKFGLGQDYMWRALNRYPQIAAKLISLFSARFDVHLMLNEAERAAKEAAISAEIDADLVSVSSLDEDRILRRFRNLIQAAVRTNFFQIGPRWSGARDDRLQVSVEQGRGAAAAAPAIRDLSLQPARRGIASALRQGRARRHSMVRPPAGLPDGDPRPRQGAAGQERRHRARRRQGRLRAEAPAATIEPRGLAEGGHRELQDIHRHIAGADRQSRRQCGRSAAQHGAP